MAAYSSRCRTSAARWSFFTSARCRKTSALAAARASSAARRFAAASRGG
eukprot:CAMPEP_0184199196 /NCGR_PEP_ID=MMETSP0976-20121227/6905_1 /TAXON_ID=483370 /ORGANISM="non described non described, Strain CCMP2097" /LENGTH=48 /DNA_ID= /DNA_START= /DNA_END= /DNA_ORIENTATION=